jgi:hypothetical protein
MFLSIFKKKKKYQPIIANIWDDDYLKEFIYKWNINFPVDKWYRDRYKIPFGSPNHRKISFLEMRVEYEEYLLFESFKFDDYKKDKGDWLNISVKEEYLTDEEKIESYKKEFNEIDLSQYDN